MSKAIKVSDNDDMPCEQWKNTDAEVQACPMQEKWYESEIRTCPECGHKIAYNYEEDDSAAKA